MGDKVHEGEGDGVAKDTEGCQRFGLDVPCRDMMCNASGA